MARELEAAAIALIRSICGATLGQTPDWLVRPGKRECGARWPLIQSIYTELTGLQLPDVMRSVEHRTVDAVLLIPGSQPRIFEFDEKQHFNEYRATTLRRYGDKIPLAFDAELWIDRSESKKLLEGGGFGKPKPPLFPGDGGRHRQRAFRDALTDILPLQYGWMPTLRIADFEVSDWIQTDSALTRMAALLEQRLGGL